MNRAIDTSAIFPFTNALSEGIDADEFVFSHLQQPDLFLRIRPERKETVLHQLKAADVSFQLIDENTIVLPNATKIEELIMLNKDAVVQDYSSQRVGSFLDFARTEQNTLRLRSGLNQTSNFKPSVWDCCAASGGKSIMAKDILGDVDLLVSDIRESILVNLKKRFQEAGIKNYSSKVIDLSNSPFTTHHRHLISSLRMFLVLAPVPGDERLSNYLSFCQQLLKHTALYNGTLFPTQ